MLELAAGSLILVFVAGTAGSFHCLGMCGGFACALGRDPRGGRLATIVRHLTYNTGRVVSYAFLGALAGALGAHLMAADGAAGWAVTGQRALAVVAGGLMIAMSLQLLGLMQRLHLPAPAGIGILRAVLHAPGAAAPLAFGVFNGFLPCPLVYAFVALAAASADPLRGAVLMAVFGLGTFPAMLLAGGVGGWARYRWRRHGVRVAGVFILVLGAVTMARGLVDGATHPGHWAVLPGGEERPAAAVVEHRH